MNSQSPYQSTSNNIPHSNNDWGIDSFDDKKNKLAQLFLRACFALEHQRSVINGSKLSKMVWANESTRIFTYDTIFNIAQEKLRDIFGMELIEAPEKVASGKEVKDRLIKEQQQLQKDQKRKKGKNKATQGTQNVEHENNEPINNTPPTPITKAKTSTQYILTKMLPGKYYESLGADFMQLVSENGPRFPDIQSHTISLAKSSSVPFNNKDLSYSGFVLCVVVIIALSGNYINSNALKKYLRKVFLCDPQEDIKHITTPILGAYGVKLDDWLDRMEKQGYVSQRKEIGGGGEEIMCIYVLDQRALGEFSRESIIGVAKMIYGEDWDERMEEKLENSLAVA